MVLITLYIPLREKPTINDIENLSLCAFKNPPSPIGPSHSSTWSENLWKIHQHVAARILRPLVRSTKVQIQRTFLNILVETASVESSKVSYS